MLWPAISLVLAMTKELTGCLVVMSRRRFPILGGDNHALSDDEKSIKVVLVIVVGGIGI